MTLSPDRLLVISKNIQVARLDQRKSAEEVAMEIGITVSHYWQIEEGYKAAGSICRYCCKRTFRLYRLPCTWYVPTGVRQICPPSPVGCLSHDYTMPFPCRHSDGSGGWSRRNASGAFLSGSYRWCQVGSPHRRKAMPPSSCHQGRGQNAIDQPD